MIRAPIILVFTAAGLTACQTTADSHLQDALISNSGPASLAEISETISAALGGRKTLLADDILTVTPSVIIDPKYVEGSSLQRPDHFRLQTEGSNCHLLHVETGKVYPLPQTRCTPV